MASRHRLMMVKAHPDDESFGNAGLILDCRERGIPVYLICATRGEAGIPPDRLPPGESDAAAIRLRELAAARDLLGLQRVDIIGVADGRSQTWDLGLVRNYVLRAMRSFNPTVTITFGPEGVTGHQDHITVGQVTTEAFHDLREEFRLKGRLADGVLSRLYYVAVPKELEQLRPGEFHGRDDITSILDVNRYADQKRAVVRCHASQVKDLDLDDPSSINLFNSEYLFREFPPSFPGLRETDIFPDLSSDIIA